MPRQPWLPLAMVAPRSRLLWMVTVPALTPAPYLSIRNGISRSIEACFAELVAQQPAAVIGDDQLDVDAALEQRGDGAGGVDGAAGAGDGNRDRDRLGDAFSRPDDQ